MKKKLILSLLLVGLGISSTFAQTLTVNTTTSEINWKGTKKIGEHFGVIAIKSGEISINEGQIIGGEVLINMNSIKVQDTDDADDQKDIISDISSKKFFNTKDYLVSKIVIKSVENGKLIGDLTIKGITQEISFNTTYSIKDNTLIADSESFSIDRQKWKLKFSNWLKENVLDDPIWFTIHIEASL